VLQAVAATIGDVVRESDAVGRLGGDEFAVLLPETDACGARAAFTMLRDRLAQLASENQWPIGFSVGVAVLTPPLPSPDHAIQLADHLMYRVKSAERNDLFIEEYGGRDGAREGAHVSWDRGKGR
jgi:diguanylate cyclase (GGDEF)-like protein